MLRHARAHTRPLVFDPPPVWREIYQVSPGPRNHPLGVRGTPAVLPKLVPALPLFEDFGAPPG